MHNLAYRKIETHRGDDCNRGVEIEVRDPPDVPTGVSHEYDLLVRGSDGVVELSCPLEFHIGDMTVGTNGVTHEAILAVLIDRLEGIQAGRFACGENVQTLWHLKQAKYHMKKYKVR